MMLFLVRVLNWLMAYAIYRLKVIDGARVPAQGGALLVCNHMTFADPSLVMASLKRPVRFLMVRTYYEHPLMHSVAKAVNAIPIAIWDKPKQLLQSLAVAHEAVEKGEIVCIFAEAGLTRHGNMLPFKKGFEYIMKGLDAPIIPVHIDRMWGSIFSYENGRYFWKWPKKWPYPVTVSFGKPLPSSAAAHEVRLAVQELSAEAFQWRGTDQKKLHIAFIDEVKKHPFKFCVADSSGLKMSCAETLAGMFAVAGKIFKNKNETGEKIGILLPSSCAAVLANGAALMSGHIPVNLNFTASKESLDASIAQCEMKTIITARLFLKKLKMEPAANMLFMEDVFKEIPALSKAAACLVVVFLPAFLIKKIFVRGDRENIQDIATIIFSSGSTGEPKGVMLSHANIFSNIEGLYQVLKLSEDDIFLGVLPFFHSFGFTATLCLPLGAGIGAVYHANPLDADTIGDLAQKHRATVLMGTPTFLALYLRKCTQEQFSSLKHAVMGAEKLKPALAVAFYEKFKVTPYEGYGATELSPVVSMTIPDYLSREEHIKQVGFKEGTVGHPIPGVAVKAVDPDTLALLPFDQEGLLLVKGPNVMRGYLKNEKKTAEVMRDGWYITGDIGKIDSDGFIQITDRLSRFSKISGEMVPHIKIEDEILKILEAIEPLCVVTSVSDDKRGERLIVLYQGEVDVQSLWEKLNQGGLPKLWIPKREDFYQIDAIPFLGTGKLDLKNIKSMASERTGIIP